MSREINTEHTVTVTLALDGIYYLEAKRMTKLAVAKDKEFVKWATFLTERNKEIDEIFKDPSRDDDEAHDLCVEVDRHWQSVDHAATELIRKVAATHILSAASLEAHINVRAQQVLNGKTFEEFDKLSISGKWLFYPLLVSAGRFDPGKKPFQQFQTLIKRRNALVHYRVKRAKTRHPYDMPPQVDELGLRHAASKESLMAVSAMVKSLAKMEHRDVPDWVDNDWCSAFEVDW
jgi:hypothetical protein